MKRTDPCVAVSLKLKDGGHLALAALLMSVYLQAAVEIEFPRSFSIEPT